MATSHPSIRAASAGRPLHRHQYQANGNGFDDRNPNPQHHHAFTPGLPVDDTTSHHWQSDGLPSVESGEGSGGGGGGFYNNYGTAPVATSATSVVYDYSLDPHLPPLGTPGSPSTANMFAGASPFPPGATARAATTAAVPSPPPLGLATPHYDVCATPAAAHHHHHHHHHHQPPMPALSSAARRATAAPETKTEATTPATSSLVVGWHDASCGLLAGRSGGGGRGGGGSGDIGNQNRLSVQRCNSSGGSTASCDLVGYGAYNNGEREGGPRQGGAPPPTRRPSGSGGSGGGGGGGRQDDASGEAHVVGSAGSARLQHHHFAGHGERLAMQLEILESVGEEGDGDGDEAGLGATGVRGCPPLHMQQQRQPHFF